MKFIDESISNLISVWHNLSVLKGEFVACDSFSYCHVSDAQFKNRIWINDFHVKVDVPLLETIKEKMLQMGSDMTLSVWSDAQNSGRFTIINQGFLPVYQQYGMYFQVHERVEGKHLIQLKKVDCVADAVTWSHLLRKNFNYNIAPEIVLKGSRTMNFYIVRAGDVNVGTVILHVTGDTLGIHSLGIIPEYRNRGYADELVQVIKNHAADRSIDLITLQATAMGSHLYEKAGFVENYLLSHYTL